MKHQIYRSIRLASMASTLLALLVGPEPALKAAAAEAASQPVGLFQVQINSGANFISAPLHRIHAYRGVVTAVGANSITVGGNPNWTANQFGPAANNFRQFIVLVRKTAAANSTSEGEWWPITQNTTSQLTVDNRSEDLTNLLAAGDHIEIRHLTSLKDLFGAGASLILNQDSDGTVTATQEDIIRLVVGTAFTKTIFYHDGSLAQAGYYIDGQFASDGATVTVYPDQPLILFRKTGAPPAKMTLTGQVQTTVLKHYLAVGGNAVASPFPTDAPIGTSLLLESGWRSDSTGNGSAAESDILRSVVGTGFQKYIFHHDGSLGPAGWYVDGIVNNAFPFEPGKGYVIFVKGPNPLIWSQAVPYP